MSPRSQPSERITTTAPARQRAPAPLVVVGLQRRADPRPARPVLDARGRRLERRSPGCARRARASVASAACRRRTSRRPVPSRARRAGRAAAPARRPPSSRRRRGSARACAAPSVRLRKARSTGSPPVASEARTSPRTSSARPCESRRRRRVRRSGRETAIAWISRLARANSSGVIAAKSFCPQHLVVAPGPEARVAAVQLRAGAGRRAPAALAAGRRCGLRRRPRLDGSPQEPRVEGAVERVDVLPPRDERLPQRPVDVVAAGQVDRVEPAQRIRDPARPHLEPGLAQHAAERDEVPGDVRYRARALATRPASVSSRTESRSSWYLSTEPSVVCTFSASSSLLAERRQRVRPVDRLGETGRLLQVELRAARRRTPPPRRPAAPGRPARAASRSPSRARATDGRSSGRGSGA